MASRTPENPAPAEESAPTDTGVTEPTPGAPDLGPAPELPGLDSPLAKHNGGPGLVFPLLLALKKHVRPLAKDNPMEVRGTVRYRFRGIDDLYNHLHGLLGEFGLLFVPAETLEVRRSVFETPGKYDGQAPTRSNHVAVTQRYTWLAADGSTLVVEMPGEGMDHGDKGTGKALSMAQKYGLVQSLNLPTGEPDADDFLTEGTPAVQTATPSAPAATAPATAAPAPGGGPAPAAPLTAPGRQPFKSEEQARATIQAIQSAGEMPGIRRRIFDSVNGGSINGGEANTLMAELEQHVKGLRNR